MFHRMMNYGELEIRTSAVVTKELVQKLMPKFKRYEDLLIIQEAAWEDFKKALPLPVAFNENSPFSIDEDELAALVCQTAPTPVTCRKLALERTTNHDGQTIKSIRLLLGQDGVVTLKDSNILYQFNVTKCVLSSLFESVCERSRLAQLDCSKEVVVDLFAGIGHFSLPLLLQARAKHLYACDWSPQIVEALRKNLKLNNVDPSRYTVIEGDNRATKPVGVAQRVILGILPSGIEWLRAAVECLDRRTGGILHCHDLVEVSAQYEHQKGSSSAIQGGSDYEDDEQNSTKHNNKNTTRVNSPPRPTPAQPTNSWPHANDGAAQLSQSISSNSSNSTIEKILAPSDDLSRLVLHTSESEKDTNSPVFLDKPPSSSSTIQQDTSLLYASLTYAGEPNPNNNDQCSRTSSANDDSISSIMEPPQSADNATAHSNETRGQELIESIRLELDTVGMSAKLLHVQPVRSLGPNIQHVVFDIKVEPREIDK